MPYPYGIYGNTYHYLPKAETALCEAFLNMRFFSHKPNNYSLWQDKKGLSN